LLGMFTTNMLQAAVVTLFCCHCSASVCANVAAENSCF